MGDPIASPANPRIKALVRLRSRRHRDASGTFVVDGRREVARALHSRLVIDQLFVCPALLDDAEVVEVARGGGIDVVEVAETPFRKAAFGSRSDGVLAVARQFDTDLAALALPARPLLLVAEGVEKPGNLGTMIRTAAAAGADGVVAADPVTDLFNPNVVRASLGTLFEIPTAVASVDDTQAWLAQRAVPWLASSEHGGTRLWSADLTGAVALVVGSEHQGLSERWLADPDRVLRIPAPGAAASLNAAMAAGLLLFEAVRQRSAGATR